MKLKPQKSNTYYSIILCSSFILLLMSMPALSNKSVYGYLEPITLNKDNITLTAKLDTGAVTSSISAKDIHIYEQNDKEYVKFKVDHPEIAKTLHYDLPIARHARIKKRSGERSDEDTHHSRPEVNMHVLFDGKLYQIRVNLIDRSHFSTPMLLGRRALAKFGAIVDGTTQFTLLNKHR